MKIETIGLNKVKGDVTYLQMNADGLQQFEGGVSRQEGHKDMLENSHQESRSCWCQKWERADDLNCRLTW